MTQGSRPQPPDSVPRQGPTVNPLMSHPEVTKQPMEHTLSPAVEKGRGSPDPEDDLLRDLAASQARRAAKRTCDPALMQALVSQGIGDKKWFSRPSSLHTGQCDAQIQALGAEPFQLGVTPGFVHPLVAGIPGDRPKLTNTRQGGWRMFDTKWERRLDMLVSYNRGGMPPDNMLLEELRACLDEEDQLMIDHEREKNRYITYDQAFELLRKKYDKDDTSRTRRAWESLKIPQGDLSVEKWETFYRRFQMLRDRLEDWTPQEEFKILPSNSPKDGCMRL